MEQLINKREREGKRKGMKEREKGRGKREKKRRMKGRNGEEGRWEINWKKRVLSFGTRFISKV